LLNHHVQVSFELLTTANPWKWHWKVTELHNLYPIALVKMEVIRRRRETDTMFQEIQLNMDKIINRHNSTLKSWIHYCSNTSWNKISTNIHRFNEL